MAQTSAYQKKVIYWQPSSVGSSHKKTFAIAVNKQFVPKSMYQQTVLSEGDQVELVIPMQGG